VKQETAKRRVYESQLAYLQAGNVDGLVENQDADGASRVSVDEQVNGTAALKAEFRNYAELLGNLDVLSTDEFAESGDGIFFEATVKTSPGQTNVYYHVWVMHGEKISHHFTGVYP